MCHAFHGDHNLVPPPPDSTLTLANVIKAVAGVDSIILRVYLEVPASPIQYSHTNDQIMEDAMRYWLQYGHNPSWSNLAGALYYIEKHTALKRVMEYIQQPTGRDMNDLVVILVYPYKIMVSEALL